MLRRGIWLVIPAVLILMLLMARNGIAGYLAERWIVQTLGINVMMGEVRTGLGFNRIEIDNLSVNHPDGSEWVTQIAAIAGEMAPLGLFKQDLHFRTMNLAITEAVVSREERQFKLLHLTPLHPKECKIDRLDWSVERVKLIDNRTNPPKIRTINVNVRQTDVSIDGIEHLEKTLLTGMVKTGVFDEKTEKGGGSNHSSGQIKSGLKRTTDKVKTFFQKTFKKE